MENNFKYIVYQTINIVNNKIYIGIHKTNPNKFDGYIGCGVNINYPSTYMNPKYPFQYAVKKYGTSNFRRSILYIFNTEKEAFEKEAELVNIDFISRTDTYNVALGGKNRFVGLPSYNKIYQFDINGKLLKEWDDVYKVSNFLETWKQSIYSAINNKSRLYNYYWSFNSEIQISEYSNPNNCRKVYKYLKSGKCVSIYNSIGEAAKDNNMTSAHIIQAIKNGMFSGNNYYSYELYDTYIPKPRLDLKNKIIFLYDLDGNFIKEQLVKDFKKEYNIHSYKEISNLIINKSSIKGLQIRLEKYNKIDKYIPKNKKKPVIVYTITGEFVEEFESITSACKKFGFDSSTVSKILRGCGKSTKGYTIKYKN